jgi:ABC-type glycerol-3-phosphate transport system substrate-binding protein
MKKTIIVLTMVLIMVLSLVACNQQTPQEATKAPVKETKAPEKTQEVTEPAEDVVVTYWHTMSEPESEQLQKVIDVFESANPGIKIEATKYAYDDFKSALITSLSGGSGADAA